MAKSIYIFGFLLLLNCMCYGVFSLHSDFWHKAWGKYCVNASGNAKEMKQLRECDKSMTKERKSLLSYCIDGIDSPLLESKPYLCQIPNDWKWAETRLFYKCMNKSLEEIYKSDSNKSIKDYDFDLCITKLLAPEGWEKLCIASNVPSFRAKMKTCSDSHPLIKKPIKECVAKNPDLKAKIANIAPIPCQYLNHKPQLQNCIETYENELKTDSDRWEKYRARKDSFKECLRNVAKEINE